MKDQMICLHFYIIVAFQILVGTQNNGSNESTTPRMPDISKEDLADIDKRLSNFDLGDCTSLFVLPTFTLVCQIRKLSVPLRHIHTFTFCVNFCSRLTFFVISEHTFSLLSF